MNGNGTGKNGRQLYANGNGLTSHGDGLYTAGLAPDQPADAPPPRRPGRVLHRIAEVRKQQGVTLRTIARHLHKEVRLLKQEEDGSADLRLSALYAWQEALGVPVADLLVDSDSVLSAPVLARAQLVKVMKTVAALLEIAESASTRRLAQTLADQLIAIMPELEGISPWPTVGQRRSQEDYGRAVDRRLALGYWRHLDD